MIIGVDAGLGDIHVADGLARAVPDRLSLPPEVAALTSAATHTVQVDEPRFVVSVFWPVGEGPDPERTWQALLDAVERDAIPGPAGLVLTASGEADARTAGPEHRVRGAWVAVTRVAAGTSGRLVTWPGAGRLHGRMPVAAVLREGGVSAVRGVGGVSEPGTGAVVDVSGLVRPRLRPEGVVLQVQEGPGDALLPFEVDSPPR